LIVDKITGKKTVVPPTTAEKTAAEKLAAAKNIPPAKKPPVNSVVKPPLTDEEIQAELDKAKAAEEPIGLPDGAIKNADGTYSVIDGDIKTTYNADGSIAGMESTTDTSTDDTTVADNTEPEYYEDEDGNRYIMGAGGSYELAFYADGSAADSATDSDDTLFADNQEEADTTVADNTYIDPDSGETWNLSDSGMWTLEGDSTPVVDDTLLSDNTDYTDYTTSDNTDYIDYPIEEYVKRGGLITMMKNGGGLHMSTGGSLPDNAIDNGNGTYTIGRFTYDMDTDEYLYSRDNGEISYVSADSYPSDPSNDYYSQDSLGNYFKNGELFMRATDVPAPIANVGSGPKTTPTGNTLEAAATPSGSPFSAITDFLGTTAGAAGAGALLASILGSDMGGGTGAQNQGLDMSKVGVINPRTTDFGIGPTRFAGFEDYGTSGGDYTPNAELLKNLNAPGYNPVNEGDYGYDEVPVETPKMSSGGLSSMATPVASYYTFGQPADILANLGMRPPPPMNPPEEMPQIGQQQAPQQAQQQGLPQQMPPQMAQQTPQGMPQQGMMPQQQGMPPPMRKGGLPHISNVPMTQGRMDFRQGSAVHGEGDGQSDDIPAMLADGEYVIDSETVAQIGNGSTKAGAQALDKFREGIRAHKRSAPINKIPPKTKALTSYLKGAR
jgi:hypothetical protein